MTKVLICGSRDYTDYETFSKIAQQILKEYSSIEIISGGARGADALAERFAKEYSYKIQVFPADWDKHGKKAGMIRNNQMIKEIKTCDTPIVIAFWDGKSKGTKNTINLAKKENIHTYIKYV